MNHRGTKAPGFLGALLGMFAASAAGRHAIADRGSRIADSPRPSVIQRLRARLVFPRWNSGKPGSGIAEQILKAETYEEITALLGKARRWHAHERMTTRTLKRCQRNASRRADAIFDDGRAI